MKGSERNYSIVELEALCIVCGIKVFEHILKNSDKEFTIQTDNRALVFVYDGALTTRNPKLLRYSMEIPPPNKYKIVHVPGKLHQHVDTISRFTPRWMGTLERMMRKFNAKATAAMERMCSRLRAVDDATLRLSLIHI